MNQKSVKFNTVLNAFRLTLIVLVPLISFPYVSRIFLTDGMGQLDFSRSFSQIFTIFASLGIYSYGVREGAKVRSNPVKFTQLVRELFTLNLVSTVLAYAVYILLLFLPVLHPYRILLLIMGLNIGFAALGLDWIFGVYEDYIYITIRQIAVQIFTIAVMFLFIRKADDLYLWAALLMVSAGGSCVFNFFYARKKYMGRILPLASPESLYRHIHPVLILFATQISAKVYSNLDTVLLGFLSTDHHTGLYSAGVKINTILITFFTAMSPVFMPRVIAYQSGGNDEEYYAFLKKIFQTILCLSIPAVVGLEILSGSVIRLIAGESFLAASVTLRILAPMILITSLSNILYYDVIVPCGEEERVLQCTLTAAVINLCLNVLLIPGQYENGAAIGSLAAETMALVMAVVFSLRVAPDLKRSIPSIKNYVLGVVVIVLWCKFCATLEGKEFLILAMQISGSVVLYGAVLFITRDMMWAEGTVLIRQFWKKTFGRRRNK